MKNIKELSEMMNQPMDRRAFLKNAGLLAIYVFGAGFLVNAFTGVFSSKDDNPKSKSRAYSANSYGG